MYTKSATTLTPATIIYLIDISNSMNDPCGSETKIMTVKLALSATIKEMARRSMADGSLQRRYKIAIVAYNDTVQDILGGIRDLSEVLQTGIPDLQASGSSNTANGFAQVEALLQQHMAEALPCPTPLVCHLTDGLFTTTDPTAVIKRICAMSVTDGSVLLENIFVANDTLQKSSDDLHQWRGVLKSSELKDEYARFLYRLSSPLPESYRNNINSFGYNLQPGTAMFFPGLSIDLIRLAFSISAATPLK